MSKIKKYNWNGLPNYEDRYINHADIRETRARARRLKQFKLASQMQEVPRPGNQKHQMIRSIAYENQIKLLDHVSYWELGTMAVVLFEPYINRYFSYECEGLYQVRLPSSISPYCGRWFDEIGVVPWTGSFLATTPPKKRQLDKVLERLKEAAVKMPPWNYIEEDDK